MANSEEYEKYLDKLKYVAPNLLKTCENVIEHIETLEHLGGVNKIEGMAGFEGTKMMLRWAISDAKKAAKGV